MTERTKMQTYLVNAYTDESGDSLELFLEGTNMAAGAVQDLIEDERFVRVDIEEITFDQWQSRSI